MINGRCSPERSIMRPSKLLKCYGLMRFANEPWEDCASGPYQGFHSFPCTRAALATRSHVYRKESTCET